MSGILDAKKDFLRLLKTTEFSVEEKLALAEYAYEDPALLIEKFPEVAQFANQSIEFQCSFLKLNTCIKLEELARKTEEMDQLVQPVILAEAHHTTLDRHFDMVNDYDKLLRLEKLAKNSDILNSHRKFKPNKKKCNKQCIIGFVCVLYRNDLFKKYNGIKPGPDKTVTLNDALAYCQERYKLGSTEILRKKKEECIIKALERIPGLKEFERETQLKNLNKQRS